VQRRQSHGSNSRPSTLGSRLCLTTLWIKAAGREGDLVVCVLHKLTEQETVDRAGPSVNGYQNGRTDTTSAFSPFRRRQLYDNSRSSRIGTHARRCSRFRSLHLQAANTTLQPMSPPDRSGVVTHQARWARRVRRQSKR
jgi:hypothetical protein